MENNSYFYEARLTALKEAIIGKLVQISKRPISFTFTYPFISEKKKDRTDTVSLWVDPNQSYDSKKLHKIVDVCHFKDKSYTLIVGPTDEFHQTILKPFLGENLERKFKVYFDDRTLQKGTLIAENTYEEVVARGKDATEFSSFFETEIAKEAADRAVFAEEKSKWKEKVGGILRGTAVLEDEKGKEKILSSEIENLHEIECSLGQGLMFGRNHYKLSRSILSTENLIPVEIKFELEDYGYPNDVIVSRIQVDDNSCLWKLTSIPSAHSYGTGVFAFRRYDRRAFLGNFQGMDAISISFVGWEIHSVQNIESEMLSIFEAAIKKLTELEEDERKSSLEFYCGRFEYLKEVKKRIEQKRLTAKDAMFFYNQFHLGSYGTTKKPRNWNEEQTMQWYLTYKKTIDRDLNEYYSEIQTTIAGLGK